MTLQYTTMNMDLGRGIQEYLKTVQKNGITQ